MLNIKFLKAKHVQLFLKYPQMSFQSPLDHLRNNWDTMMFHQIFHVVFNRENIQRMWHQFFILDFFTLLLQFKVEARIFFFGGKRFASRVNVQGQMQLKYSKLYIKIHFKLISKLRAHQNW